MDKFIAAMSWYVGRDKSDPEYVSAPFYYSNVSPWFDRLSLDNQERGHTVVYVYSTPGYGRRGSGHYLRCDAAGRARAASGNQEGVGPRVMPWTLEDRLRTEEYIAQALQYIAMQERRIEELKREGHGTDNAEELLRSLRQTWRSSRDTCSPLKLISNDF
jgi:hypothetical protein